MNDERYIAYYRVSTRRQGRSGLGLDAQRKSVAEFLGARQGQLIREFVETESGTKNDRPELAAALEACRLYRARLVIAKLDRLARNASFLLSLRDAGVDFICCDMPDANRLTVGILAMVAEDEADRISRRTKAALAAAKARGVSLGAAGPKNLRNQLAGSRKGNATKAVIADDRARELAPTISELEEQNVSLRRMAEKLNYLQIPAARGGNWTANQVRRLRQRISRLT